MAHRLGCIVETSARRHRLATFTGLALRLDRLGAADELSPHLIWQRGRGEGEMHASAWRRMRLALHRNPNRDSSYVFGLGLGLGLEILRPEVR